MRPLFLGRIVALALSLASLAPSSSSAALTFPDAGTIGSPGSGPGQLSGPNGLALDDQANIYVADTYNRRINRYSPQGAFQLSWGTSGIGNGQFQFPYGIDVNSSGEVFVGDLSRGDIQVFSSTGSFLRKFGTGIVAQPFGLYVSDAGEVFVTDRPSRLVHRFTTGGAYLGAMGPTFPGASFSEPQNVEGRDASRILVSDGSHRVHQLSTTGTYETTYGVGVLGNSTGTTVLGNRLFVTEYAIGTVRVIDMPSGVVEAVIGDNEPYTFSSPFDAAFQGDSILLILEAGASRIRRLRMSEGSPPTVVVSSPTEGSEYRLGELVPITWIASDDVAVDHIEISISRDGGLSYSVIVPSTPNSGFYQWPAAAPYSNDCRIRVTAFDNEATPAAATNPGLFRIVPTPPEVVVLMPNGGESYGVGAILPIRWSVVSAQPVTIQIDLSRNAGRTFQSLGTQTSNTGQLDWLVGGAPSESCLVRVTAFAGPGVAASDQSDALFTLAGLPGFDWSYAGSFGTQGSFPGAFSGPDGIAVSDDGRVYVADTYNSRVQWFDRTGNLLGQFGGGNQAGGLRMVTPYGIDVDAGGFVYVSDFTTKLVKKFSASGDYLGLIGDSTSFSQPLGLWVSDEGTVYVTDRTVGRVRLFDASNGAARGSWGPLIGPVQLRYPQNIEGDGCGLFYLSDGATAFQLRTLDGGGQQIEAYRAPLGGNPTGSALAGSYFFLTEYNLNRLSVRDLVSGTILDVLGDNEPFSLNSPIDAATMGDSMLYVLDTGNNRVIRMRLPALTAPTVELLQPNGGEVVFFPAPYLITWNASDDVGVESVDLLVSRDGGLSWAVIAQGLPDTGQYEWTVSGPASDHCLVRVIARDAAGGVGKDRSDLEFAIVGFPVPTLLVSLFAEPTPDGIALQWQLADPVLHERSSLERSDTRDGAYVAVEGVPTIVSEGRRLLDRQIEPGRAYWYRVVSGDKRFGPIAAQSGSAIAGISMSAPNPNPTTASTRLEFALPRSSDVELAIHDIAGREIVRLVSGERPAGRHVVSWSGEDARGRVVPGLYFARLAVHGEGVQVRRIVLTR